MTESLNEVLQHSIDYCCDKIVIKVEQNLNLLLAENKDEEQIRLYLGVIRQAIQDLALTQNNPDNEILRNEAAEWLCSDEAESQADYIGIEKSAWSSIVETLLESELLVVNK